jgi:hypothetical protein
MQGGPSQTRRPGRNSLTRGRCIGSALFNPSVICGSPPVVSSHPGVLPRSRIVEIDRPIPRRRTLTLIVRLRSLAHADELRRDRVVCACTHYLVFKEPTPGTPGARAPQPRPAGRSSLGEPFKVTTGACLCQPPNARLMPTAERNSSNARALGTDCVARVLAGVSRRR